MGRSQHPGRVEQLLLFAILRLGDRAHGLAIRREVEKHGGGLLSPGAVYTTLSRLESRGLVDSWLSEERPEGGGRRRKFYRVEPEGAQALQAAYRTVTSLARGTTHRLERLASTAGPQGSGDE